MDQTLIQDLAAGNHNVFPKRPLVHPNGFIQLYLEERRRIHVWPEEPLKGVRPETPLHDHIYGFQSRVWLGKLTNITYQPVADPMGWCRLYRTRSYAAIGTEAPVERIDDQRYKMRLLGSQTMTAGSVYRMEPFVFHDTVAKGLTVTMVDIDEFDPSKSARLACPVGESPAGIFRRDAEDPEMLWKIITRAMAAIVGS